MQLRCDHRMHAILEDGVLEVKCKDRMCVEEGQITLHYFRAIDGKFLGTRRYRDPARRRER